MSKLRLSALLVAWACVSAPFSHANEAEATEVSVDGAQTTDTPTAPLLEGIGSLHFPISTDVPRAQAYFNQALTLAFGFNHAEAARSFREAARLDPTCGICYWGAALALGPNINAPMMPDAVQPAWSAVQEALARREFENEHERAYIDAIVSRYSEDGSDRATLDLLYAGAMAGLVEAYPEDLHARTLYAESLMDLMPWSYWNDDGSPASTNTTTLVAELETVLKANPDHPGAAHLYIHAMEQFEPKKAEAAADRLGALVPVAGHLVHMPSHIYLRVGRYADAVDANAKAAMADEDYIAQCNAQGLYPAMYYPHNVHFLWYSAMMDGRKALALDSALKLAERVPVEVAKNMPPLQSYLAVPMYTYLRFGMWDEALALPVAQDGLPFTEAMHLYGHGLAYAAKGDLKSARQIQRKFKKLMRSKELNAMNMRREDAMPNLLSIASNLLDARIQRTRGNARREIRALKRAVKAQDELPYTEPPLWHFPVRQALGDAYLRDNQAELAQTTFDEDLYHFPKNPWSLYGVELALGQLGQNADAATQARTNAWQNADIEPTIVW